MTRNRQSISSNGEVLNQKQEHHIPVTLDMNDFLVLRLVLAFRAWYFLCKQLNLFYCMTNHGFHQM